MTTLQTSCARILFAWVLVYILSSPAIMTDGKVFKNVMLMEVN